MSCWRSGQSDDSTHLRAANFIECVRMRQKLADIELDHRVSTGAHLGNFAYKTGRKLRWSPQKEEVVGDAEAAELWDARRASLGIWSERGACRPSRLNGAARQRQFFAAGDIGASER